MSNFLEALEALRRAGRGYIRTNGGDVQYQLDEAGRVHWTHFGSVGGLVSPEELTRLTNDPAKMYFHVTHLRY